MTAPPEADRFAAARAIADAVLYEGYVLYPYRATSQKNQLRWQFGVLVPRSYAEADGSERSSSRTECLVAPAPSEDGTIGDAVGLRVRLRCLQVQHRAVEACDAGGRYVPAASLEVDGRVHVEWDEARERTVDLPVLGLPDLEGGPHEELFVLEGGVDVEALDGPGGVVAGRLIRHRREVRGMVRVEAERRPEWGGMVKVAVTVENRTEWADPACRRDDVMAGSLVAVHTMMAVDGGLFVSLLDPPVAASLAVSECRNDGTFPVLVGAGDLMLSSPIILYDFPSVAPESPGDLYDGTEIDEILALRVLTLTDGEKAEARGTDRRAAAVIDRCDDMPPEMWERLHGAVRSPGPAVLAGTPDASFPVATAAGWWDPEAEAAADPWTDTVLIAGTEVGKGSPVRLAPSHRADAQDVFLRGMTATVAGIFKDVEGCSHVAVTVDDDPATVELTWQGRYLFFHPDEIEPLPQGPLPQGPRPQGAVTS